MDANDKRLAAGAIGALAVCCTVQLIILAGGLGALSGVAGGLLASPYLVMAGLALLVLAAVAWLLRRANRGGAEYSERPAPRDSETTSGEESTRR